MRIHVCVESEEREGGGSTWELGATPTTAGRNIDVPAAVATQTGLLTITPRGLIRVFYFAHHLKLVGELLDEAVHVGSGGG